MNTPKRIGFFFPSSKATKESQTIIVPEKWQRPGQILARMRECAEKAILSQYPRPSNGIELSYMLDYHRELCFAMGNAVDPRFDLLSKPPNLFEEFPVGFYANFFEEFFQLIGPDKADVVNYTYDQNIITIIAALERGHVSPELLAVFRKRLKIEAWEDGHILCKIVDYRFDPPFEYLRMLEISNEVISAFIVKDSDPKREKSVAKAQQLEAERRIALLVHPRICLDPAPDVARVQSILDWRRKMWMRQRDLEKEDLLVPPQKPEKPPPKEPLKLCPLKESIEIPASIFQAFANANKQAQKTGA
jgi:hypothetical protein